MQKILVAYIPGPPSEAALEFAVREAQQHDASLLVLASEGGPSPAQASRVTDTRPLEERLREFGAPYDLRAVARRDDAADAILEAAESEEVDLVVLGIRKRTPVGKFIMGSTSQRVVFEAPAPVVLVKPQDFVPPPRP